MSAALVPATAIISSDAQVTRGARRRPSSLMGRAARAPAPRSPWLRPARCGSLTRPGRAWRPAPWHRSAGWP